LFFRLQLKEKRKKRHWLLFFLFSFLHLFIFSFFEKKIIFTELNLV